ncbi:MAG TPA: prepilin-type N-terminal cleavage/methylation domain-containing protein [Phycisphaerae bacterium]|nr:prepilin-type N-terminal cleavage/methylation domain-containing protein [Phycisphaerae bacterium]
MRLTVTDNKINRLGHDGFTLIELLVVIAIMSLLMTIIISVSMKVISLADEATSLAMIKKMSAGVDQYHSNENGFFPGQQSWARDQLDTQVLTGSELLARAVFTPKGKPAEFPDSAYADYRKDDLFQYGGVDNMISDDFPTPMPILYYPSHTGKEGSAASVQYNFTHNRTIASASSEFEFLTFITDPEMNGLPYCDNSYIIIGAGLDRKYFTEDDLTNINRR